MLINSLVLVSAPFFNLIQCRQLRLIPLILLQSTLLTLALIRLDRKKRRGKHKGCVS